jgi:C-lobe and N-lobe beta barrels of Tf-binding protein B
MTLNGTTTLSGKTTEGAYTSTAPSYLVNNVSSGTQSTGTVAVTEDGNGNQTQVVINGSMSSVTLNSSNATSTTLAAIGAPGAILATTNNGQNAVVSANQQTLGYNYQTYGVWATGLGTGSGNVGAISVGSTTPNASIPSSGSANFSGNAGGLYVDASGNTYLAMGSASLNANFGTQTISLTTTSTQKIPEQGGSVTSAANLNLTGNLTYSAGNNNLSGNLTTADGMTGAANGSLYGPAATEIGGTFAVSGGGVKTYIGSFGAKR